MRLIDADVILDSFCTACSQEGCEGGMAGTIQECTSIKMWRDIINDITTAYDVDKVVEELEVRKNKLVSEGCSLSAHQLVMAIKIVKAGGVDDNN